MRRPGRASAGNAEEQPNNQAMTYTESAYTSQPQQDNEETITIFRAYKDSGDVIALFPEHDEGLGRVSSYMRIGQHGAADYAHVIAITRPASEAEYEDLAAELESLGYRLRILKKKPISL